jgi:hypothetical protein
VLTTGRLSHLYELHRVHASNKKAGAGGKYCLSAGTGCRYNRFIRK